MVCKAYGDIVYEISTLETESSMGVFVDDNGDWNPGIYVFFEKCWHALKSLPQF